VDAQHGSAFAVIGHRGSTGTVSDPLALVAVAGVEPVAGDPHERDPYRPDEAVGDHGHAADRVSVPRHDAAAVGAVAAVVAAVGRSVPLATG
jgi:hypothetical protein